MTILGLKKSVEPVLPILGELQEKFFLVTTMCDAPHMQYASKYLQAPSCCKFRSFRVYRNRGRTKLSYGDFIINAPMRGVFMV